MWQVSSYARTMKNMTIYTDKWKSINHCLWLFLINQHTESQNTHTLPRDASAIYNLYMKCDVISVFE